MFLINYLQFHILFYKHARFFLGVICSHRLSHTSKGFGWRWRQGDGFPVSDSCTNNVTVKDCSGIDCHKSFWSEIMFCSCERTIKIKRHSALRCCHFVQSCNETPNIWLWQRSCRLNVCVRVWGGRLFAFHSKFRRLRRGPGVYAAAAVITRRTGDVSQRGRKGRWQVTPQTGWFCHFSGPCCHFYSHL